MKKSKDFYVYLHRRKTDGKVFYVGKGTRYRAYSDLRRSDYWKRIVAKYGYTVEFYATGLQEWYAFELEKELIAYYGRENLCNLTDGGEGSSGWIPNNERIASMSFFSKKNWNDAEYRKKTSLAISKSKIGKKRPDISGEKSIVNRPGVREKISNSHRGSKKPWLAGKLNPMAKEENRIKLSIAKTGINQPWLSGGKNGNSKKIICLEENIVFDSISLAVQFIKNKGIKKASAANITACAKFRLKTAYGYTWRYA